MPVQYVLLQPRCVHDLATDQVVLCDSEIFEACLVLAAKPWPFQAAHDAA